MQTVTARSVTEWIHCSYLREERDSDNRISVRIRHFRHRESYKLLGNRDTYNWLR